MKEQVSQVLESVLDFAYDIEGKNPPLNLRVLTADDLFRLNIIAITLHTGLKIEEQRRGIET